MHMQTPKTCNQLKPTSSSLHRSRITSLSASPHPKLWRVSSLNPIEICCLLLNDIILSSRDGLFPFNIPLQWPLTALFHFITLLFILGGADLGEIYEFCVLHLKHHWSKCILVDDTLTRRWYICFLHFIFISCCCFFCNKENYVLNDRKVLSDTKEPTEHWK